MNAEVSRAVGNQALDLRQTSAWWALAGAREEDGPLLASLGMGRTRTPLATLCVGIAVTLSACSTVAGTPVADPSVEAQFKLDTGNYPTTPREVKGSAPADFWQQEGFLIGNAVVAPWEVDPSITESSISNDAKSELTGPVWLPTQIGGVNGNPIPMNTGVLDAFKATPFQAGFVAVARDKSGGVTLRTALFRFPSEEAVRTVVAAASTKNSSPGTEGLIAGATTIEAGNTSTGVRITSVIPRGSLLALVSTSNTTKDAAQALLTKAVAAQAPKMGDYKPSPSGAHFPEVPMDRDGIMSRTLASTTTGEATLGLSNGIYIGDGYMTGRTYPLMLVGYRNIIDRWGIELVGRTMVSEVFRFSSEEKAGKFLLEGALALRTGDNLIRVPGMDAQIGVCADSQSKPSAQPPIRCAAKHGRYVAVVQNLGSETAAKQAISAQYMILKSAK